MVQTKLFNRRKEDFICENCAYTVEGNGYTNHCQKCFYSKHVDINPGDRAAICKGLMRPIAYETNTKKGVIITHQCLKCGISKRNKLADTDELTDLLKAIHGSN